MNLLARWKKEIGATRLDLVERYLFDANGVYRKRRVLSHGRDPHCLQLWATR
jgi:hypothetical protein